ncbi:MAG: GNAT family N-acetyltransferase [Verrucomicrobiales bacterium]|nr:GNAT family N-acetyltransferase [Verrucomicrobiales bacterium]
MIRHLHQDDLDFAESLVEIAGWNQLRSDWLRLLSYEPEGCFLIKVDGIPAGTATTTTYGDDLGWIGMVLIHPDYRRRGLATALLNHCVTWLLDKKAVGCVKLDATPDGMKVYEKLGFTAEYELSRWIGRSIDGKSEDRPGHANPVKGNLDQKAFGADRRKYLERLAEDSFATSFSAHAFGMVREGRIANYLGPVVSQDACEAVEVIKSLLRTEKQSSVIWDIPEDNHRAVDLAEELGFKRQRRLIRMWTGPNRIDESVEMQWAIGGPETG